jgi:small-conductance mechanosensitive channel
MLTQIFIVLLSISLITNVWGSFRYSFYVTNAISASLFYGLLIYLLLLIVIGITTLLLFSRPASQYNIVKKFKFEIEHRLTSILRNIGIVLYLFLVLRAFRVSQDVIGFIAAIIEKPFNIGDFTFAFGDIILFFIVILVARWMAKLTVFILDEQILYKPGRKKDVVASVSSLVKFSIITFGFIIGLIAIGVELDKLTILISAFGVGIGFGLQNIFNNLVSGIIMVFERPLQVGDVIQVGTMIGTVKSIGIRSSVVRTFDGSEVIVPNGNLISNELINWTHSDMQRRLSVKVGIAYGTDPKKVIDILVEVADKNESILKLPKPYVLFNEFGDSSLNFELRCWTDDFDNWIFVASDLHVEVNNALKEAGITIPFPQRDVHMYGTDTSSNMNVKE